LVTGFGYEHDEKWNNNMKLFKQFTDITQGVRRLGAASVDLCHIASGIADGFWEFDLKPWDVTAGMIIVKEAGGSISKMKGEPFSIFDDQIIASNGNIHSQMVREIGKTIFSCNQNVKN
jgi:myo-inositol-1(or 4)-monophosphatase